MTPWEIRMTAWEKRLTPLARRMAEDMLVRNLSPRTIDSYTYHIDKFTRHAGQPAERLGPEQIRQYQLYLIRDKKVGWSTFNQTVCALRFLYRFTVPRDSGCVGAQAGGQPGLGLPTGRARTRNRPVQPARSSPLTPNLSNLRVDFVAAEAGGDECDGEAQEVGPAAVGVFAQQVVAVHDN